MIDRTPDPTTTTVARRRPRALLWVLALALGLAGAELYGLWHSNQHPASFANAEKTAPGVAAPATTPPAAPADESPPIGAIDTPQEEAVIGPRFAISGWALASSGMRSVEIRIDAHRVAASTGGARPDVAAVRPGFPDSARAGFEFNGDLATIAPDATADRRTVSVVAIAGNGRETVLGTRTVIEPAALARWRDIPFADRTAFFLLPALSGISLGGAEGLASAYAPYLSSTMRAGLRVPILYLRTTRGAAADYAFDPEWNIERRCGVRRIAEDSLRGTLDYAARARLPLLVTLNGGVWADASCDVPDWDVNDHLEQVKLNCQWNERNEVMPDDALKHLPGSQDAPELGRSLTFNVYARDVRHYKRRNLQAAAGYLLAHMHAHPDLWVGVNLDPDSYVNPFFGESQWYDYNPGTLRQFREWLSGSGPYAGKSDAGVPDLSAYRRARPLTLAQASALAGRRFARWADVDPPRSFPRDAAHSFWKDPWVREWELFRRHLVHLHYDELAQWLVAAGFPRDRIWSSQGLMAPAPQAMPFAIRLDSPVKNYDSGGMTVAGSRPRDGHLGVIVYGPSAVNDIRMEEGRSLFATLQAIDPAFGVVEFNTADLRDPKVQPTYAAGYRSLRDLWNHGARFVSPMAWNGSNGLLANDPAYVTFTAWRNTPLEEAARDFLLARAGLPLGSLLWTFGTSRHADDDGWTVSDGALALAPGAFRVTPGADGRIVLTSPAGLALDASRLGRVVVGLAGDVMPRDLQLEARAEGSPDWRTIERDAQPLARSNAGVIASLRMPRRARTIDQVRVRLGFADAATRDVHRIAILGAAGQDRAQAPAKHASARSL